MTWSFKVETTEKEEGTTGLSGKGEDQVISSRCRTTKWGESDYGAFHLPSIAKKRKFWKMSSRRIYARK